MNDSEEILVLEPVEDEDGYDYADSPDEADTNKRRWLWPIALGVGLIAGLIIAFAFNAYTRPAPYDDSALNAQIAVLRSDVLAIQNQPAPIIPNVNLGPLTTRIKALEARPTVDPLSEEIVSRLEALQAEGFELPEIPDIPDFSALESRITALEAQVENQATMMAQQPAGAVMSVAPASEPFVDPDDLPNFPAQVLRDGAAEIGGTGFLKRTFSQHVRVRGSNAPEVLIRGIEADLADGKPRAALAKFDRLSPELQSLARAWRANMEEAL